MQHFQHFEPDPVYAENKDGLRNLGGSVERCHCCFTVEPLLEGEPPACLSFCCEALGRLPPHCLLSENTINNKSWGGGLHCSLGLGIN